MNDFNLLKNNILDNNITLIVTNQRITTFSILNLINDLSMKNNYKTCLYSTSIRSSYYSKKLVSLLSGINVRLLDRYYFPHLAISKNNKEKINRDKFIDTIERVQNSNLVMSDEKDYIDNISKHKIDILIIDNLYNLLYITKYNLDELLNKLRKEKNMHFILFINKKDIDKNKIMNEFDKHINNFIFINGSNCVSHKDINIELINNNVANIFNFKVKDNKVEV